MDSRLPALSRLNRRLGLGLLAASAYLAATAIWLAAGIRNDVGTGSAAAVAGILTLPAAALALAGWVMFRTPRTAVGRTVQGAVEVLAVLTALGFMVGGVEALAGSAGWGDTVYVLCELAVWVTCGTFAVRSIRARFLRRSRVPAAVL